MASLTSLHAASGRGKTNERGERKRRGLGGRRGKGQEKKKKRRKWEQKTKKETGRSKKEDAEDWECQGKGQLPLQHFSLINGGKRWPG